MEVISSGRKIDLPQKFAVYTAEIYVILYPWHFMNLAVQKILLFALLKWLRILFAWLNYFQKATEMRNKLFVCAGKAMRKKRFRESCRTDIVNKHLLSSDSLLSFVIRLTRRKKTMPFLKEKTLDLFLPLEPTSIKDN